MAYWMSRIGDRSSSMSSGVTSLNSSFNYSISGDGLSWMSKVNLISLLEMTANII